MYNQIVENLLHVDPFHNELLVAVVVVAAAVESIDIVVDN
jgi:hypothetical protein